MTTNKRDQKLVSFTYKDEELKMIQEDINSGWSVVSLVEYGGRFVGIMEKSDSTMNDTLVYIPPRKKIRLK